MLDPIIISAVAAPMIETLVKELFVPKFRDFLHTANIKTKGLLDKHQEHFNEYLNRAYDDYSLINSHVISNSQVELKEVYLAPTLVKTNFSNECGEAFMINQLPVKLIQDYGKILISDTAGMGKSTIMKYMFIDLINNSIKDVGIPIYIELNQLKKGHTIIQEIQEELKSFSKEFDEELLLEFIHEGGFIFFLDGYDEIAFEDRNEVTKDIKSFISKAGTKNYYIMSSRPEDTLPSFTGFQLFKIQPFTKEEALNLLSKYDFDKQKSDLLEELKTGEYESFDDFLKNPLLVSVFFSVFNDKKDLSCKKKIFYQEVFNTYATYHDSSKGYYTRERHSRLGIEDIEQVLKYIGYIYMIKPEDGFDRDNILRLIGQAKKYCRNSDFNESDLLLDIIRTIPLFYKNGDSSEYEWTLKSLMRFYAVKFLANEANGKQSVFFEFIYNNAINNNGSINNFISTLDIYYDIDKTGFNKTFVNPLCENFINYYEGNLDSSMIASNINKYRVGLLFHFSYAKLAIVNSALYRDKRKKAELEKMGKQPDCRCREEISNKYVYLFALVNNYHYLLHVLYMKEPNLYVKQDMINKNKKLKNLKGVFSRYEINGFCDKANLKDVDVRTGKESREAYVFINELLIKSVDSNLEIMPLDYEACKRKIHNIGQIIAQSQTVLNLLPS